MPDIDRLPGWPRGLCHADVLLELANAPLICEVA